MFILSQHDRDGLAGFAGEAGWRVIASRRPMEAEQRFLASDVQIVVIDARRSTSPDLLVEPFAGAVEATGGALIALVGEGAESAVPQIMAAGATHYLAAPFGLDAFAATLSSAQRLVERLGGDVKRAGDSRAIRRSDALRWRFDREAGEIELSEALAAEIESHCAPTPRSLLKSLSRSDRVAAIAAIRMVAHSGGTAAFAHDMAGGGRKRVAHHLHADKDSIVGEVELLPGATIWRKRGQRDYLTGLSNRAEALLWLDEALMEAKTPPIILLLSVSQLDRVNTAYGQMAGDALLGRLARRMERLVDELAGTGALLARITGTEFLIGLSGEVGSETGMERAKFLARRLVATVSQPFNAGDHLIRLTGRCGIAGARKGDDAVRLLRHAAMALADARQSDGEGIRIFTRQRHSREVDPDRLEADLRLALDRGEIGIVFQPQYATGNDELLGVEALARWTHPEHGALGAGVLFATAERSDFLLPLSAHIHAEALRLAAAWPSGLNALRLSINVTAADISQPDFLENFLILVDRSGFPRGRLTVEITESGLVDDIDAVAVLLNQMRAEGLRVAIDDFGTGYSSLAYLKALPLDYLKIDSGLAQDIAGSARDRIIVRGVIQMARSLGLTVIAEGVETEQQLSLLAREGCEIYQGFLRSPAISSDQLAQLV
ncbi:putative bifunctional diguanylate cyclase/phosphodiesterase [Sphingobium phenoxybenzoativorans]|uniref:putative bifunctional diguanylate cyclase/phosphodiesterase n=1 Tax=Sphingobium phenoxybenzoativorans TaxID=1592790 RepID=UPI0008727B43|nr:bifunctional diguanylate cyclase/phosphodiesterase [Sphingobium phenoxybenzoativorans]